MAIIPVADFTPDQAAYLTAGLQVATNTLAREDGADTPLRGPSQLATALAAPARGAVLVSAGFGSSELVAGTASGLYTANGTSWTTQGSGYAVPDGRDWRFTQFGTRVLATNYADAIQQRIIGGGSGFSTLSSAAPKARYIATIEPGFCMVGDYVSGANTLPNGLWWSALNDCTNWPTPGTSAAAAVQSDNQQLPLGDAITGLLPAIGGASGAVWTERSIYRIQYVGGSIVFAFQEVDRSRGCVAPGSLIQAGTSGFFLSEEGFCAFDGAVVTQIGVNRVDRFFWSDVDVASIAAIRCTVDPYHRVIVWYYPSRDGTPHWLSFNYATNRWRFGDDAALAIQCFVQRISPGVDETLTALAVSAFKWGGRLLTQNGGYLSINGTDRLLIGSNEPANFIAAFNASNALVGYAGTPLAATIETGETDAQGRRVFVSGARPLTDAADVTVSIGARDSFSTQPVYTTPTNMQVTGICPQRISTRYARARMAIPAGAEWTYVQGADVMLRPEGLR
jgi:hypothetical protein